MTRFLSVASAVILGLAPAVSQAAPGLVQQRLDNQQQRINNGVASGALTGHEAARDQAADQRLQTDRNRDLTAHGGHLTAGERSNLNRRLNHTSGHIYDTKHNARVAAPGK